MMRQKAGAKQSARIFALLLLLLAMLAVTAYAAESPLVEDGSGVTVQYNVNGDYPWRYDEALSTDHGSVVYVAGNSGENNRVASVSNIALTVTGKGTLTFAYRVDTPETTRAKYLDDEEYYGLFYNVGSAITDHNSCSAADNFAENSNWLLDYAAKDGWGTVEIPITSSGTTTIYVAYFRDGTATYNNDQNYVAISNVSFSSSQKTLAIQADSNYGSVAVKEGENDLAAAASYDITPGATVTLTAAASNNGIFYGWTEGGALLSTDTTYTTTLTENRTIQAVFAPSGTYTARRNGIFYTASGGGLKAALDGASSGDTVIMLASQTLSGDATVPEGVVLVLPCKDNDPGYVAGYCPKGESEGLDSSKVQRYSTLTIPSGTTLTVNGAVLVNAVTGLKAGTSEQGIITGGYAAIALDGTINVTGSKAMLDNFGYVTGTGQVNATQGGKVGDRYEVTHWRGGSNAVDAYGVGVYPMNETNCHSIQTTVTIDSSSSFVGLVRMYEKVWGYHDARFTLIGGLGAMIQLNSGATATKTYADGRSTVALSGGATFSGSSMTIAGSDVYTRNYVFPVDGDVSLVMQKGTYAVDEDFKLLPGSTAELMSGATLTVNAEKTLALYATFIDTFNANLYPANRDAAELTIHGGATLRVNGTIGGRVKLAAGASDTSYAKVILGRSATLTSVTKETSVSGGSVTAQAFTFPLTLWNSDGAQGVETPTAGTTYYGTANGWTTTNPVKLPGDLDNNNTVNINDLKALLDNYGKSGSELVGDINSDGTVNINDLKTLLDNYGKSS
jgi:hypothetical protein